MPRVSPDHVRVLASERRHVEELAALGAETPTERRVKRIVPWVFSALIHLGLILIALVVTWTVTQRPEEEDAVLIVADFDALDYDPVAPLESSEAAEPDAAAFPVLTPPSRTDRLQQELSSSQEDPLKSLFEDANAFSFDDVDFAPKTAEGGASFVGVSSTNARRIVYVIDASGSMVPYLQVVLEELSRSLGRLAPPQQFSVIFFQEDRAIEVPPAGKLTLAGEADKLEALRWIRRHVIPAGGTNPVVALEKAVTLQPDVIFLLSQNITGYGKYEVDQAELLAFLNRLNPVQPKNGLRGTRINCIQFLDPDPLGTMVKIAEDHGGPDGYKFLDRSELGLGAP